MSRKRQDTTASQRSMGDFVSRAGSRNPVEIIDDEDDEVEEINTVSIKMDKRYQVLAEVIFVKNSRSHPRKLQLKLTIKALTCNYK